MPEYIYVAFYKGKQIDVCATSAYVAQQKAAALFNVPERQAYKVIVVLAEIDGKAVIHLPTD